MYVVFKDMQEWFQKEPGLKEKFSSTYQTLLRALQKYASNCNAKSMSKVNKPTTINFSPVLLKQVLVDAFDDLMRLTNYHITDNPNRIKEMSYIVYWFLRHKPIYLISEELTYETGLNEISRARLLFINESFCVRLLLGATFPKGIAKTDCIVCKDMGTFQLEHFRKFLLYYLVYRAESPKSIEAILVGTTVFPIWEVDPMIWDNPGNPEDDA